MSERLVHILILTCRSKIILNQQYSWLVGGSAYFIIIQLIYRHIYDLWVIAWWLCIFQNDSNRFMTDLYSIIIKVVIKKRKDRTCHYLLLSCMLHCYLCFVLSLQVDDRQIKEKWKIKKSLITLMLLLLLLTAKPHLFGMVSEWATCLMDYHSHLITPYEFWSMYNTISFVFHFIYIYIYNLF